MKSLTPSLTRSRLIAALIMEQMFRFDDNWITNRPTIYNMANINGPIPAEWQSYVTQSPNGLEIVPAVLYDTATYTTAVTTDLPFFTTARATADLSNMQTPGQLPSPQSFLIQNISVGFKVQPFTNSQTGNNTAQLSLYNDLVLLINTGILRMVIGEKRYGPWPLSRLPLTSFVKGVMVNAGATAANLVSSYANTDGPLYALFPNLLIAPLQQFSCNAQWPAGAVTLTTSAITAMVMTVILDGQLSRAIQ